MRLIVTITYFQGDEKIIPKELAIYDPDSNHLQSWIFAPPFLWDELEGGLQDENSWLQKHVHGLTWQCGDIPSAKFSSILHEYTAHASALYTFGPLQSAFLSEKLGRHVIDLQELDCPRYQQLAFPHTFSCSHILHRVASMKCAVLAATSYGTYLKHRDINCLMIPEVTRPRASSSAF